MLIKRVLSFIVSVTMLCTTGILPFNESVYAGTKDGKVDPVDPIELIDVPSPVNDDGALEMDVPFINKTFYGYNGCKQRNASVSFENIDDYNFMMNLIDYGLSFTLSKSMYKSEKCEFSQCVSGGNCSGYWDGHNASTFSFDVICRYNMENKEVEISVDMSYIDVAVFWGTFKEVPSDDKTDTTDNPKIDEIINENAKLSCSDANCVVGNLQFFFGYYTAKLSSELDSELTPINFAYDEEALEITNVGYSKSGIDSANISGIINAKKAGVYPVSINLPNSPISTKTFSVNIEPMLVIKEDTVVNSNDNFSDFSLYFDKSRFDQSKTIVIDVSIDDNNPDYLNDFLASIKIEREDRGDLVMGKSDYITSYTISEDGKSAEYVITITTQDLDIRDYLKIETSAQTKIIRIARDCTNRVGSIGYTEADLYMIEEVEKYCSDQKGLEASINNILSSDNDWETRQNELLRLLNNNGLTDIQTGISYVNETSAYRRNYELLVNDEIWCANQFNHWIMSDDASGQRLALYSAGLIFNNEFLGSFNFSTDLIEHFPEAKKNKEMLKKFLETTNESDAVLNYSKKTSGYIKNAIKVLGTDTIQNKNIANLQKQMLNCKDNETWLKLQRSYTELLAGDKVEKDGTIHLNAMAISKALGYSTSVISFTSATTNDIIAMIELEEEVETYQQNLTFLKTIANSPYATYAMAIAADSLMEDISLQYYRLTEDILRKTFSLSKGIGVVKIDIWKGLFEDATAEKISNVLLTYKLAVFLSNCIIGTDEFVKETAYAQGYAQLSSIYSDKLKKDRSNFLSKESKENAWQFFEDYTILWNLRYKGEEQYEKAQHVKALFDIVDSTILMSKFKSGVIQNNLETLDKIKFNVDSNIMIPSSVQYMKKAVIHCPVDVRVYTSDGTLIIDLKDGIEFDCTNAYGRFAVVYNPCTDEYEKVICQTTSEDLKIEIVGVAEGNVNYEFAAKDEANVITGFNNEVVQAGDIISLITDIEATDYSIDYGGDSTVDIVKQLNIIQKINCSSTGDINCDSTINILDVIVLNKYILGVSQLSDTGRANADVNQDGNVDSTDSLNILKYVVELIKSFDDVVVRTNNGKFDNGIVWNYDGDGTLSFSGEGVIPDFTDDRPWSGFNSDITQIILNEGITSIGTLAFQGCTSLETIQMPATLTSIKDWAFSDCLSLNEIVIPEQITSIGTGAFDYCSSLSKITIYSSKCDIADSEYTFTSGDENDKRFFKGVIICNNNSTAYQHALKYKYQYELLDGEHSQWDDLGTDGLIYDKPEYSSKYSICGYKGESGDVIIPEEHLGCPVTSIQYGAFNVDRNSIIKSIVVPNSITSIPERAFYEQYLPGSVKLGDNLTYIGEDAFSRCEGPENMECIDGVTYLDDWVIGCDSNISSIKLKPGTRGIIGNVFEGKDIKSITIPESVYRISEKAFADCKDIQETVDGIIYVDDWAVGCNPGTINAVIKPGTVGIADFAFEGSEIESITIPDSVSTVGIGAFFKCKSLESVKMSENISIIRRSMFWECSNLKTINIPENVTLIDASAFYNCSSLTSLIFPSKLAEIGFAAFENCTSLTSIIIPDSVTKICNGAFYGCSGLKEIVIGKSVSRIEQDAFWGCKDILTTENGVNYVDSWVVGYESNNLLANLVIKDGTRGIADQSFMCSPKIKTVFVPGGIKYIGCESFKGCKSLSSVVFSQDPVSIGHYAFQNCTDLVEINISRSGSAIVYGEDVFKGCDKLK